jgi:LPS export ABC transporter protein LptC
VKRTGFLLLSFLLIGIFLFREGRFTNLDPTLTINQNKFLLSNPNWVITNKTSKHTYKLTSSQASVNFSNEKFIIKKASVKTLLENKIENSISSDEANLELDKKKLVLKKKVHLQLPQTNGTIHLFTELLNLDLKNNLVFTNYEVELRSEDFGLKGESLELKENLKGEALITFKGVNLNRKEKNEYEEFGSADAVFLKEGSNILILQGSAKLKLESMNMIADEIKYNYKTRVIINSKNSTLFGKS